MLKPGEHGGQHVLAAEIRDDPLLDLAVFAIGFDDADIFVDSALGGRDFDRADVHGESITTGYRKGKGKQQENGKLIR